MYSTHCPNCRQLLSLKTEQIGPIVAEAEAAGHAFYSMPCPKCRKPIRLGVKDLKHKLLVQTAKPDTTTPPAE